MIVEETIEKLLQLHLKVMAQSLREIILLPGAEAIFSGAQRLIHPTA